MGYDPAVTPPAEPHLKQRVRSFWEAVPCGTRGLDEEEGGEAYFHRLERERHDREPFIASFARFESWRGRRVLEVGVGAGTDFVRFARVGARLSGIDLTAHGVELVRRRLALEGLRAEVLQADAERLPFADAAFDLVYSWGVIHHTPDPRRAAAEIERVLRPGGEICVMVYNRRSLVALQCWILNALLRGRPGRSLGEVIAAHIESPGTQAFSITEARGLFAGLADLRVTPVVTPYDARIGREAYLPAWTRRLVPRRLGWFLVVTGRKGAGPSG